MADKLMYISKDNTQNYNVERLGQQLNEPTNQNSNLKSPKLLSQRIRKLFSTLEIFFLAGGGDNI